MIESVRQQQQFTFGVYRAALRARRQPGVADSDAPISRDDFIETRGPDDFTPVVHRRDARATLADDHEWQLSSLGLTLQCSFDISSHRRASGYNGYRRIPKLAIGGGGDQRFFVRLQQRFQTYMLTFKSDRRDFHCSFLMLESSTRDQAGSGRSWLKLSALRLTVNGRNVNV